MNQEWLLAVIGLVAAAFVLRPLIRGRAASAPVAKRDSSGSAGVARSGASDELAELDLDRSMGRISEADYARWREEVESDLTTSVQEPDAAVTPSDAVARAEALVRQWRDSPRSHCPTCGDRPEPEAKYCSNCGVTLS